MKQLKIYILFAVSLLTVGCSDFLDRTPHDSLSPKYFWKSENDLRLALNNLYNRMNRSYTLDDQSIDCFSNVANHVSSGTLSTSNTDGVWSGSYRSIRIANDFLENYERSVISETLKNRYAGEAKFFRAYYYFNLIRKFGDVPFVTSTLDMSSPELMGPRVSTEKILDNIIADLTFAEEHIPPKSKLPTDVGRVTKGAAQALLARITLYYGTYFKFHGGADYKHYLEIAKGASKRLIDSHEYELYKDYRNLFLLPGEDSSEHILSYRYSDKANSYNPRIRGTLIDFTSKPTKHLADAFLCKDGLPIGKSKYTVEYLPLGKEFENRDPRMKKTFWVAGDDLNGAPFMPNLSNQTRSGYVFKKYSDPDAIVNMRSTIDEILMRYAEVLLIYAEASYELDDQISDADLNISINALRNRFEGSDNTLPALTNAFVQENGLSMREEIRRERRVELCFESFRYDDLVRWKTAETELMQNILGVKFDANAFPEITPGQDVILNEDGFILIQRKETRSFEVDKNYIFPLPLREISLNKKLEQNPNWD